MTPSERAALLADVAAAIRESMQQDAAPRKRPRPSHVLKRRTVRCENCGNTTISCRFVRVCKICGGLMMVYEEQQK